MLLLQQGYKCLPLAMYKMHCKNTLGLDRINITTGSIDPDEPTNRATAGNYNIEIGKYIVPKGNAYLFSRYQ